MRLVWLAIRSHISQQWSSQANFWSGVLGMFVNNAMTLLGIWAMLFAGKGALDQARDAFFLMNFVIMLSWGAVHVFLGGITNLDRQINEGSLDLALTTPRNPFLMLSLTSSSLPAWADVLLGALGIFGLSFKFGILFFLNGLLISCFSMLAMYSFYLVVGCLAFWFRRTEAAYSVLVNMFLAFNTYPIFSDGRFRWAIFVAPALLGGVIPSHYLLQPTWPALAVEVFGSLAFFLFARLLFATGLKRYQSAAGLGLQRL